LRWIIAGLGRGFRQGRKGRKKQKVFQMLEV
jgi:hypothetical protein